MEFTVLSIFGAFLMLILGVVDYAVLRRFLYRPMRERYERAKLTMSQGADPNFIWGVIKFLNLVVLPIAGFFVGEIALRPLFS